MEQKSLPLMTQVSRLPGHHGKIHSCSFCSVQEIDPTIKTFIHEPNEGSIVKYRGSRVLDGASKGCAFFQDMITYLEPILKSHRYGDGSASARKFQPENWTCVLFLSEYLNAMEYVWAQWTCAKDELPGVNEGFDRTMATYCVMACEGDPSSESIFIRPFVHDFKSTTSNLWARKCLEDCMKLHEDCKLANPLFIPTRLLRLERTDKGGQIYVYLETTAQSERVRNKASARPYSTLSYCWGGEQTLQLNTESEETLTRGIPASSLPKTLLDATVVTWNLGLRLLWIDCLCIRQDDPEDKAIEIASMPAIYGNSFITISAARASHSREGFLHHSSLPSPAMTGFKLPFACPDGRLGSAILSREELDMPLNSRAWTLQEYLLARRVLQFTNFQLHWTCRGTAQFEQEDKSALPLRYVRRLEESCRMYRGIRNGKLDCKTWMGIVEEFSRRKLTYSVDKLPAISGIAEFWATASGDCYVAGLWRSHLPLGLLWTSGQPHLQIEPKQYRAPSWTWASLVGQVDWFTQFHTYVDPVISIEFCATTPTYSKAPYGTVISGSLIINCLLQETVLETASSSPLSPSSSSSLSSLSSPPSSKLANEYLDLSLAETHMDYWDDAFASIVRDSKLYCLQICCFEEISSAGPAGLILATKDEQTFCRVGFFVFMPPQPDDVKYIDDFNTLVVRSETSKRVQRGAFQESVLRKITVV